MNGDDAGAAVREATRKRDAVLAEVVAGAARKPALVDAVGVSRSTVDRAVDDLTGAGLVEDDGGTVRATVAGELALSARREYESLTDALGEAEPLLSAMPEEAPLDRSLFAGADVALADPQTPEAALDPAIGALSGADRLRGFAPVVKSNYASVVYREVRERGLSVELIVGRGTLESAAAVARGREDLAAVLAAEEVDLLATEGALPYALWIAERDDGDETVGVTVHDAGAIVGVLTTDDPDAAEWARGVYRAYREDAEAVDPDALGTE
ncbi:helix-turn-helix transcriptional regulator [Halobaculum sp. EA56]|uniref:helix-turn-helix transcriptional regulator n=1 Tax=Halobaculum sp. EA56 TaxID=3421648 RepID=UPI003EBA98D4